MNSQTTEERRDAQIPDKCEESGLAADIIYTAVADLKAPYPRWRNIRTRTGPPRKITRAELETERREFCENFEGALDFVFGEDSLFEVLADSLLEMDAEMIRAGLVPILEHRRYVTNTPDQAAYLPVQLRDKWRVYKRQWNFRGGFGGLRKAA